MYFFAFFSGPEDTDVVAERERMQSGAGSDDLIRLEGLRKVYKNGKVAVNNLWFSIPKNECFGFLGVNGAGKTSAIKILTGDELPTAGKGSLGVRNHLFFQKNKFEVFIYFFF